MKKQIDSKKFNIIVLVGLMFGMIIFALPTIIVDPFFHYHAPLESLQYPINNERYQNNGIARHFIYDAMITGTSMTESFRASEMDTIFGVNTIKVSYSGSALKETRKLIETGLESNENLKIVLRSLDQDLIIRDKNYEKSEEEPLYPHYLNDDNIFNDVHYVLNKSILAQTKKVLENTRQNGGTETFDEYSFWADKAVFGKEEVLSTFKRAEESSPINLSEQETQMVRENIYENIVRVAEKYPNTDFYVFIPPWSVCWWSNMYISGSIDYYLSAERVAIEEMLTCDNIRLFSFANNFEWTSNLEKYKDQCHYSAEVNSEMLQLMHDGKYQLTENNYEEYLSQVREYYMNYDYESIFEEER